MIARCVLGSFLTLAMLAPAGADTLFVAPPNAVSAGHPLYLGPDHKAGQVGDVVNVVFNLSTQSTESDVLSNSKNFNVGAQQGTNTAIKLFNVINIPTSITGSSGDTYNNSHTISSSFSTTMMATVVDVLPSGNLVIAGDQMLTINGISQKMHITGVVRPDDISNTDSVPSTNIANLQATFQGNFRAKNAGIVQRVLDFLF